MSAHLNSRLRIGVDIGGSKFRVGIVTSDAALIGPTERLSLEEVTSAAELVSLLASTILKLVGDAGYSISDIDNVGVGSPGPLDVETGRILETPNMKYLSGFLLGPVLGEVLSCPVTLANDANCFVLGEQRAGAAAGYSNVFGVTLGTGFGCGLVLNGDLFEGATGTAAEFAYSEYRDGYFEDYISGRGIKSIYKRISGRKLRPLQIENAARDDDPDAISAWEEFGSHLGASLAYVVNLVDPEVIVVGGSVSNAFDFFQPSALNSLKNKVSDKPASSIRILRAEKGEIAAVIGAALVIDCRKDS